MKCHRETDTKISRTLSFLNGGVITKNQMFEIAELHSRETTKFSIMSIFGMVAFILWDYVISPDTFLYTFTLRTLVCVLSVILLALGSFTFFKKRFLSIYYCYYFLVATIVVLVLVTVENGFDIGISGLILVLLAGSLFIPFDFIRFVFWNLLVLIVLNASMYSTGVDALVMFNNNFFFLSGLTFAGYWGRVRNVWGIKAFSNKFQLNRERVRNGMFIKQILPEKYIGDTGKMEQSTIESIGDATILFLDIVGFTHKTNEYHPKKILNMLNVLFLRYDEIAERHGLEKIKTMGDSYIVGAGVGDAESEGPEHVANFALEAIEATKAAKDEIGFNVEISIGIATGPVIAGILATKRPTFDVIGSTVNYAARLQSYTSPNTILVSEHTKYRLRHEFDFEQSDITSVRGFGDVVTFILNSKKSLEF